MSTFQNYSTTKFNTSGNHMEKCCKKPLVLSEKIFTKEVYDGGSGKQILNIRVLFALPTS